MTEIILVRHGETEWNIKGIVQGGGSDLSLNDKGQRQSGLLAGRLVGAPIKAVYSSPMKRALETAGTIASGHKQEVIVEQDLREMMLGELEGIALRQMFGKIDELLVSNGQPKIQPENRSDFWRGVKYCGGENLPALQLRVKSTLDRITGSHPDDLVVMVSHHFVIMAVVCEILNMPIEQMGRLRLDNASLSAVSIDGARSRLLYFNDTCHLKGKE
jgi:broad specificity phosphatase PhoE